MKGEHMDKEFLAINPRHCIPTIVDDDLNLWESRAILQYIVNQYAADSTLYPAEAKARAKVDFWLNWDMGSMYAAIIGAVYPKDCVIQFKEYYCVLFYEHSKDGFRAYS